MQPTRHVLSYIALPTIVLFIVVAAAAVVGGFSLASTVALLVILEVSLSFDNAVMNATVLRNWPPAWRRLFLGIGIIIAVFGMRFLFPILIVSVAAHLGPIAVLDMAFNDPARYGETLTGVHHLVAAFGGIFLLMVGLEFFLSSDKEVHWLAFLEQPLQRLHVVTLAEAAVASGALLALTSLVPAAEQQGYLFAGVLGLVTFALTKTLGTLAGGDGTKIITASIGGFLYLEVLDASFSFDGVIGAFALTNQIVWIMAGLGVGALYVRELTILCVDREALDELPHLAHGAFWAILALAVMMLFGPIVEVPEVVKGLVGAFIILAAVVTSLLERRRAAARKLPLAWGDESDLERYNPRFPED